MSQPGFLRRLLYRFTGLLRCRIINGDHNEPYLERYHLFRIPGGGGAYLHRFVDSDPDRGLHDHPWPWALGFILTGGYEELRLQNDRVVKKDCLPGNFNRIKGDDFHRIVLPAGRETWTFFIHGGKHKGWGFLELDDDGHKQYRAHDSKVPDGAHDKWWKTAPRGRFVERRPA